MIFFIICSGVITVFAVVLCLFSGQQQRKEDEFLGRQEPGNTSSGKDLDRADWDLLNNWDEPE